MIGAPIMCSITKDCKTTAESNEFLVRAASTIADLSVEAASRFRNHRDDERLLRARLIAEEVSELFLALAQCDEIALADAIADSQYVIIGTAVTFDLPSKTGFLEVHRSNMTKDFVIDHAAGIKGKGTGFQPADLKKVIEAHRVEEDEEEE